MNFVYNMYRQPLAHRNMDKFAIRYKKGVQHKSQSDTRLAQKFKKKLVGNSEKLLEEQTEKVYPQREK